MYLSRVEIDIKNRQKLKDLTHLGAYHNWVESCFPQEIRQGIRSRKLWRIDILQGKKYLLLLSEEKPDIEMFEKYGVTGNGSTKDYDTYLDSIDEGRIYRFRVTLNPVVAISRGPGERGRVVPEITAKQQLHFLEERADKFGFELIPNEYQIVERSWEPFGKKGQKTPARLSKATYEGMLKVKDKNIFYRTLTEGIGKKKAYGFGLMTVIPT